MYEIKTEDILKAQNNDKETMGNIIQENSGLLWSIVKRFLGRGYDGEELYQIACIGFIKSIKRFDTSLNLRLSTYAVPYIMGEIKRFIRDDGPIKISRSLKELSSKIKEIQKEYLCKKGEDISVSEISRILNVSKEEIAMALESERPLESINEENYDNDSSGETKISKISNGKDETAILIDRMCINSLIQELKDREKQIIILRYYRGKTQTEVAKILGITQVQISRIEKKILLDMRGKMKYNERVG